MAANNCEWCGKAFGSTNPRTFVQNHALCKSCKARMEATGIKDFENVKKIIEQEEAERKKLEEIEEMERKIREKQAEEEKK